MRQVGATIGVAVLGTVLASVYRSHLDVTGLPAAAAAAAKSSVVAGMAVAHALGSAALLDSARYAFVQGLDTMLWVCGGIALASAILALLFLPRRAEGVPGPAEAAGPTPVQPTPNGHNWTCDRMPGTSQDQPGGLRERKKARTRASIREHALRLFREQTYQGTTVEQIAAAAEVSPSTFFRYFPTKEDIVLQDDMDTRMIEALERQPTSLGPLSAVRAAIREVFTSYTQADLDLLGETTALTMTVPEVRARAMDEFTRIDLGDRRGPGQAGRAASG